MLTNARFRPIEDKKILVLDNKVKTKTAIYYQRGYVGGKIAIRFYKNNKIIKLMVHPTQSSWKAISKNKNSRDKKRTNKNDGDDSIWQYIQEMGGQSPDRAHFQREDTLTKIISKYFKKFGYSVEEQPRLGDNTPDILIKKGKTVCYIEIKAYFGRTIVAEPEIAQVMKYYAIAKSDPDILEQIKSGEINPPKFGLITTGKLKSIDEISFFNGDLEEIPLKEDKIDFINNKYKKYVKQLGYGRSLEARDTRSIYRWGWKKIEKYYIPDNWKSPRIIFLNDNIDLIDFIENDTNHDVFFIPSKTFKKYLEKAKLYTEEKYFDLISKSWMERLVFNRSLIDYKDPDEKIDSEAELEENSKPNPN